MLYFFGLFGVIFGIIGYVLDVILVYVFDPGVAGVVIVWGLSCRLNMDHQIKNTGKKSANKKVKWILKKIIKNNKKVE